MESRNALDSIERLNGMLEKVNAPSYLIANPFSKLGNEDLNGTVTTEVFFRNFCLLSNEYYERLVDIQRVAEDPNMNTVFITGFRGCGKTTFARYLAAVVNGEQSIKYSVEDIDPTIHSHYTDNENDESGALKLHRNLAQKCDIRIEETEEQAIEANRKLISEVNQKLKGKGIYVNFEVGTNSIGQPVEQKLGKNLRKLITKRVVAAGQQWVFEELTQIYEMFKESFSDFEKKNTGYVRAFFAFIGKAIQLHGSEFENALDDAVAPLTQDQLLLFIVLIDMILLTADSYPDIKETDLNRKVYYIFDNIDIIYDYRILDDFIQHYVFFIENMSRLISEINQETKYRFSLYENFVFVFVMRETSSMAISDHFNDRLQYLSAHFDLSDAVDKSGIVGKKFQYLQDNLKSNKNKRLQRAVALINTVCNDSYIRKNIFPLFNNDYKRTMACLSEIIDGNVNELKDFLELNSSDCDYHKQGARGIIFRLIFNHFKASGYFDDIGVTSNNLSIYKVTPARIILTYLANTQTEHNPHFLQNDNEIVQLSTLHNSFEGVFSDNEETDFHAFLDSLWGMFQLRTSRSWNHLITFDAIKHISLDEIKEHLKNPSFVDPPVKVRLTCAGRNYVRFVCVHYEFYAARFAKYKYPLFSTNSFSYVKQKKKYIFELIMEEVLKAVERCCKNLDEMEARAFINSNRYTYEDLRNSYFCYRNPENEQSLFHAERIIHHHVRYLDNYRMYLINGKYGGSVADINMRVIRIIQGYLDLLDKYSYYSDESKELSMVLRERIRSIEKGAYTSISIRIAKNQ